jgi:hypothetical protein
MAEETLYCPSCNQKVRVPEEWLGQPVQCPLCRLVFTAPVRGGSGTVPPQVVPPSGQPQTPGPPAVPSAPASPGQVPYPPYGQPPPYQPYGQPPHGQPPSQPYGQPAYMQPYSQPASMPPGPDSAAAALRGPGIALVMTGVLGLIINTLVVVASAWFLYRGSEDVLDAIDKGASSGLLREMMRQSFSPEGLWQNLIMHAIFMVVCIVICHGATQMMRLRSFGLAVAASILAMVNISECCCVLGLPIGIWGLVVLFRPEVRAAFEQATGNG